MDRLTCVAVDGSGNEYISCSKIGTDLCSIHSCDCSTCPQMKKIMGVDKHHFTHNDIAEKLQSVFNAECGKYGNYYKLEVSI